MFDTSERARPWLGGDARGIEGHGGTGEAGGAWVCLGRGGEREPGGDIYYEI